MPSGLTVVVIACVIALVGCTPGLQRPKAMGTAPMVLDQETASPGDSLRVAFRQPNRERGAAYRLERRSEDEWVFTHFLLSDIAGSREPEAVPTAHTVAIPLIAVTALAPDTLVLPTDLPTGTYRICENSDEEPECAPVEII